MGQHTPWLAVVFHNDIGTCRLAYQGLKNKVALKCHYHINGFNYDRDSPTHRSHNAILLVHIHYHKICSALETTSQQYSTIPSSSSTSVPGSCPSCVRFESSVESRSLRHSSFCFLLLMIHDVADILHS